MENKLKDCPIGTAEKCSQRVGDCCMMACAKCYMLDRLNNNNE